MTTMMMMMSVSNENRYTDFCHVNTAEDLPRLCASF